MTLVSTSVCCTSSFTGQLWALHRPHSLWDSLTSSSHLPGFGGEVHPHWAPRASQCPHPTTATSTTQVVLDLNSTHTVITFPFLMHFHLCGPTSPSESPCLRNVCKLLSGRRGGCPQAHSAVWASAVGPPDSAGRAAGHVTAERSVDRRASNQVCAWCNVARILVTETHASQTSKAVCSLKRRLRARCTDTDPSSATYCWCDFR